MISHLQAETLTGEFAFHYEKIFAIGRFGMEALMDGKMLILQSEELIALNICKDYTPARQLSFLA